MNAVREALATLDVDLMRKAWTQLFPHLPPPKTHVDALAAIHMARTAAESMSLKQRAYSHQWLTERQLPSQLPDRLKPKAERLYPVRVEAVGISVNSKYAVVRDAIQTAMQDAVLDCYANGDKAPEIVKPRMMEARARERRGLGL